MNNTNTGGAAFPQVNLKDSHGMLVPDRQEGMTLRDYFAAKAMQALVTSQHCPKEFDGLIVSQAAYRVADAMLAARSAT